MKISIIVPAFNEEKLLATTLRSIRSAAGAFTELGWATELIVCDNNSTDRTAEQARAEGAAVVFEAVNQIARARNRGAEAASGEWLVFVDADSCPSRGLFGEVAAQIRCGRCLGGGCTVRFDDQHGFENLLVRVWNVLSRVAKWSAGSFVFCEAAAFREVGGFSIELFVSEEIDLSRKLKKLARQRRRRMVILHRHPLLTSARKAHLYSLVEHGRFFAAVLWRPRQTLRDRNACANWYDGRR